MFYQRQIPNEDIKNRKPSIASGYLFINSKEKTQQKLITIIHVIGNDSTWQERRVTVAHFFLRQSLFT